jgi:hypothetical protein
MLRRASGLIFLLGACTSSPIDVHGSFDLEGQQTFDALGGLFATVTTDGLTSTSLLFTSEPNACAVVTKPSTAHFPLLEIDAEIWTGSPFQTPANGSLDLSVHAPGFFPIWPGGPDQEGPQSSATVGIQSGPGVGAFASFPSGAIELTEVSDERLVGTISLLGSDTDVTGSFTVENCAAADISSN